MLSGLMAEALDRIRAERVIAVLRRVPEPESVVDALCASGIRVVEITLDSNDALKTIERLRTKGDATVLAGTVRTAEEAAAAVAAGAEACVAPTLVPAMVEQCRELGVPAIPGALTPTELLAANQVGAELIKLFPGSLGGPSYVRDVLAPLPRIELIVSGGVDVANARDFLAAGAVAVGVGSAITSANHVEAEARRLVEAVSR